MHLQTGETSVKSMIVTNETSKIAHKLATAIQTHLGFIDAGRSLKAGDPRQATLKMHRSELKNRRHSC
jgi:hypothetical protein